MNSILTQDSIFLKINVDSKNDILHFLSHKLSEKTSLSEDFLFEALTQREEQLTTGIGEGIAIPHCFNEKIKGFHVLLCTTKNPVDYHSIDKQYISTIICIVAHPTENLHYLKVISKFAELFHSEATKNKISMASSVKEVLSIFSKISI